MSRRRGSALVAGVAIAMLVSGGPPAGADVVKEGGFSYVSEESVIGPGTTKTFAAKCPGRLHVLGGGATTDAGYRDAFISSSYPYDGGDGDSRPDDGWKVKISGFDAFIEVLSRAVCARLNPTYKERRYEIEPMISSTNETVPCGAGRAILHGGFRGPTSIRPGSSYPVDGSSDFWGLRVENVSSQAGFITGHAVCSDELTVTYVPAGPFNIPANGEVAGSAECPPGSPNNVGGGEENSAQFGAFNLVRDFTGISVQPAPDSWAVQASNDGPLASLTVWADCVQNL